MRIARLDAVRVGPFPLVRSFSVTSAVVDAIRPVVVRVETDEGVAGYGEAMTAWEVTGETEETVEACVALYSDRGRLADEDVLVGKRIDTLEDVRRIARRMNPSDRPATVAGNTSAKAAIEQAMLDACARAQGMPVHVLLGVGPHPVRSSLTASLRPAEETLAWVREELADPPFLIRLKLSGGSSVSGDLSPERDVEVVRRSAEMIRDAGVATLLAADANEGFVDAERTVEFCRSVEGCLAWLEQPALGADLLAFGRIKRGTDVPLMADESVHGIHDARLLLGLGGVDLLNVKLMKAGGILPALEIVDLAAERGVSCQVGSMVETSLGCLAGATLAWLRPERILSTDMAICAELEHEPWGLLDVERDTVRLHDTEAPGTGMSADDLEEHASTLPPLTPGLSTR